MENVSTGLKWAIGILVTLLIVAAGVSVYMASSGYFKRAQSGLVNTTGNLNEFTAYDDQIVTGSEVVETAKRYEKKDEFTVLIYTNKTQTGFYAGNISSTSSKCYRPNDKNEAEKGLGGACNTKKTIGDMKDETKVDSYVNPTASFRSKVYADVNGVVRVIEFVQNGATPVTTTEDDG